MVMKKFNFFIFLFLLVFSIGFISSDNCEIASRDDCKGPGKNIIMGLSGEINAHGELHNMGNYDYVLCCYFGTGDLEEDLKCLNLKNPNYEDIPLNKIIGLSGKTNAHAEATGGKEYVENVCYNGLVCINTDDAKNCDPEYPLKMLSLSRETNAHIGKFGDYLIRICCKKMSCPDENIKICGGYKDEGHCGIDSCGVADKSAPDHISCGTGGIKCFCEWENEVCKARWTVESYCGDGRISPGETCDGTNIPEGFGCLDFGCENGIISCNDKCQIDYSQCINCPKICDGEEVNYPVQCDEDDLKGKTCASFPGLTGDGLLKCKKDCTFDTSSCKFGEEISGVGICTTKQIIEGDCEIDDFLTFSWESEWVWDKNNIGKGSLESIPEDEKKDYILSEDGMWYYDPGEHSLLCSDSVKQFACPAHIKLPFFGAKEIIISIVLIILIYVIFLLKKKKINSKKKTKKK